MSLRHRMTLLALIFITWISLHGNAATARGKAAEIMKLDQAGKPTALKEKQLRAYSLDHMNASTQFELTHAYRRAQQQQQQNTQNRVNGQVYSQAQAACGGSRDSVRQAKCVGEYVSRQTPAADTVAQVNRERYQRKFSSPAWTPDIAGVSLLATVIAAILTVIKPKRHAR